METKPKFKVGDIVRCNSLYNFDPCFGIIKSIHGDAYSIKVAVDSNFEYANHSEWSYREDELQHIHLAPNMTPHDSVYPKALKK